MARYHRDIVDHVTRVSVTLNTGSGDLPEQFPQYLYKQELIKTIV